MDTQRVGWIGRAAGLFAVMAMLFALVAEAVPCLCGADCNTVAGVPHDAPSPDPDQSAPSCCDRDADPAADAATGGDSGAANCCGRCFAAPQSGAPSAPSVSVEAPTLLFSAPALRAVSLTVADDRVSPLRSACGLPSHGPPVYLRFQVLR